MSGVRTTVDENKLQDLWKLWNPVCNYRCQL